MRFLIADTFTKSLARLDEKARAAVKLATFDFQLDPSVPGFRLHRLGPAARDRGFWSLRVNRDLRIIVHRDGADIVLCHADRHDRAYAWAESRRFEPQPPAVVVELVEVTVHAGDPAEDDARVSGPCGQADSPAVRDRDLDAPRSARRLRARRRASAPLSPRPEPRAGGTGGGTPVADLLRLSRARAGAVGAARSDSAPGARAPCSRTEEGASTTRAPARAIGFAAVAGLAPALVGALGWLASWHPLSSGLSLVAGLAVGLVSHRWARKALSGATAEQERVAAALRDGQLDVRADPAWVDRELRPLVRSTNEAIDALVTPFRRMAGSLERLSRGDPPAPLAEPLGGEYDRHRASINALVEFVSLRSETLRTIIDTPPLRPLPTTSDG